MKYLALILCLFILSGCFKQNTSHYNANVSVAFDVIPNEESGEGTFAPEFYWFDEHGDKVSFQEYTKDKVVLVSYWATWCFACKMTLTELREVNNIYSDKGVVVIGIVTLENTDPAYRMDHVAKFVDDWNLDYPMILDDDERTMWKAFGLEVGGVPTTLYIDREGIIRRAISGSNSVEGFASELDKILNSL